MSIDGNYTISFKTPFGKQEVNFSFTANGEVLEGTAKNGDYIVTIREGKINGNDIEFVMDAKTPMGKMKTTVTAKIDGDKIIGAMKMAIGTTPFDGVKVS